MLNASWPLTGILMTYSIATEITILQPEYKNQIFVFGWTPSFFCQWDHSDTATKVYWCWKRSLTILSNVLQNFTLLQNTWNIFIISQRFRWKKLPFLHRVNAFCWRKQYPALGFDRTRSRFYAWNNFHDKHTDILGILLVLPEQFGYV